MKEFNEISQLFGGFCCLFELYFYIFQLQINPETVDFYTCSGIIRVVNSFKLASILNSETVVGLNCREYRAIQTAPHRTANTIWCNFFA